MKRLANGVERVVQWLEPSQAFDLGFRTTSNIPELREAWRNGTRFIILCYGSCTGRLDSSVRITGYSRHKRFTLEYTVLRKIIESHLEQSLANGA